MSSLLGVRDRFTHVHSRAYWRRWHCFLRARSTFFTRFQAVGGFFLFCQAPPAAQRLDLVLELANDRACGLEFGGRLRIDRLGGFQLLDTSCRRFQALGCLSLGMGELVRALHGTHRLSRRLTRVRLAPRSERFESS